MKESFCIPNQNKSKEGTGNKNVERNKTEYPMRRLTLRVPIWSASFDCCPWRGTPEAGTDTCAASPGVKADGSEKQKSYFTPATRTDQHTTSNIHSLPTWILDYGHNAEVFIWKTVKHWQWKLGHKRLGQISKLSHDCSMTELNICHFFGNKSLKHCVLYTTSCS